MSRPTASPSRLAADLASDAPRGAPDAPGGAPDAPGGAPDAPRGAAGRPRAAATLAAIAGLAVLAGCRGGPIIEECPGLEVAVLSLVATRSSASCAAGLPADGDQACQETLAALKPPETWAGHCALDTPTPSCCFDRLFKREIGFQATIAFGQVDDSAALCLPVAGATPYTGTRVTTGSTDAFSVSLETSGAVLASCASTCAVSVHHEVTGVLARDPASGAVTGFTGQLLESAAPTPAATCTPCTAPCAATWTLARAPAPAP